MPSTTWPTISPTRCFISRAALLVKVTARISLGRARPVARIWAMRTVSTRVLPVPAPASTRTGPSSVSTASRCSGLRPLRYGAPEAACARAAMPPRTGCGASAGSMVLSMGRLRFKGSAKALSRPKSLILTLILLGVRWHLDGAFTRLGPQSFPRHSDATAGGFRNRQRGVRRPHPGELGGDRRRKGRGLLLFHVDMERHVLGGGRQPALLGVEQLLEIMQ